MASTIREQRRPARRLSLDPLGAFGRDLLNLFELEDPGTAKDTRASDKGRHAVASPTQQHGTGKTPSRSRRTQPPQQPVCADEQSHSAQSTRSADAENQGFSLTSFVGSTASAWLETVQTSTERAVENFMEITESVDQFVTAHLDERTGGFLGPQSPPTQPYRTERLHKERHGGAQGAAGGAAGGAVAPAGAWEDFSIDGSEDNDGSELGWEGDENAAWGGETSAPQFAAHSPPQPLTPSRRGAPLTLSGAVESAASPTEASLGRSPAHSRPAAEATDRAAAMAACGGSLDATAANKDERRVVELGAAAGNAVASGRNAAASLSALALLAQSPGSSPLQAQGSLASTAGATPPGFCPASPDKGPAEVRKYRDRCEALAAQMRHFEASCERLQRENAALRARAAHAGEGGGGGDGVFMEQLAQQLQHVMQEKARLQRDKEALERDNCSLIELLEFAHGGGGGVE